MLSVSSILKERKKKKKKLACIANLQIGSEDIIKRK